MYFRTELVVGRPVEHTPELAWTPRTSECPTVRSASDIRQVLINLARPVADNVFCRCQHNLHVTV
jgi:hypothetical protein